MIRNETDTWLNIRGSWTERHDSRYETCSISAALVSKKSSMALLRALETSSSSHDYKLPDYSEERTEIDSGIFVLKGLIENPDSSKGIDQLDPYATNLSYPLFAFGDPFLKALGLNLDANEMTWSLSNGKMVLKSDSWSGLTHDVDDEPEQSGRKLSASISLLQELCKKFDSHLLIDVNLSRDIKYRFRPDSYKYLNPSNRLLIFTEDGILKGTGKDIKLR